MTRFYFGGLLRHSVPTTLRLQLGDEIEIEGQVYTVHEVEFKVLRGVFRDELCQEVSLRLGFIFSNAK